MDILRKISDIRILKFIMLNFFSSNIHRKKGCYIIPQKHSIIQIDKSAQIYLEGNIFINSKELFASKREAILFLREGAQLHVKGKVVARPGVTIQIQRNASLEIGSAYINYGATIIAGNNMKIGNDFMTSRNTIIVDSDFHKIMDKDKNVINEPRNFVIGDHVWVGLNSVVLRGSAIGDGAIIAANSLVGGKIKEHTMASGNPARSYAEEYWEI